MIHDPKNTFKIKSVWMFISQDDDGMEGVIAAPLGGQTMPLIAADETRLTLLRPIAKQIAQMTQKKVKLIQLTERVDLEEII